MTTEKHGILIATLDVASLERRFPPPSNGSFPDCSGGALDHPCPPCEHPVRFPSVPETPPYQFTDGSDAITEPGRGKKGKIKENIIVERRDLFVSPCRSQNQPSEPSEPSEPSNLPTTVLCSQHSDLDHIATDLEGASDIALDLETYGPRVGDGLNPWRGGIRLLTLRRRGGTIHVIDLRATGYDLGPLKPILEAANIIAHNAAFDLLWLRVKCGLNARNVRCTLTAARLLTAGTRPGNNLDQCLERHLGIKPAADHSRSDWASMRLTGDQLAYAARDVAHLHDLLDALLHEINVGGLGGTWDLECQLQPCVIDMEHNGIHVSRRRLDGVAAAARGRAAEAEAALKTALGNPTINLASPTQLLTALRAAGIRLTSTKEESLRAVDDGRLVPLILAHRGASKRVQQAEALMKHIGADGRIHATFTPIGTITGRFSSKEPNLQGVQRGEIREAFDAQEGRCLVDADYSQIELRAVAAITGEATMIEAYNAGADLHRLTAAAVLGKPVGDVTKDDRQLAKAVNFGLLYGQTARGLVAYAASDYGVTMSEDQAAGIRSAFFRKYTRLARWHQESRRAAWAGITEVRTRTGRRRLIPADAGRWESFTTLVNTPVQGGAGDGMKRAIIDVAARLPAGAMIVSTVHDELIVECHVEDANTVNSILVESMTEAMSALFPEVPIEVESSVCATWAEK